MNDALLTAPPVLGADANGMLMSPEEFDSVQDYDENYRYELVHGVLVVTPIASEGEAGPNEILGFLFWSYQAQHPSQKVIDFTIPERYIRTPTSRRRADRVVWVGLGRMPNFKTDIPAIAIVFPSAGQRNRRRDYLDKREEYLAAGVREYWIIDRFDRRMTVVRKLPRGEKEILVAEGETYTTPLLPGFELKLSKLLEVADACAAAGGPPPHRKKRK